jgi:hypothetical protein
MAAQRQVLHANVFGILRGAISGNVKVSDCRSGFKTDLGSKKRLVGSPLVSFPRGGAR